VKKVHMLLYINYSIIVKFIFFGGLSPILSINIYYYTNKSTYTEYRIIL